MSKIDTTALIEMLSTTTQAAARVVKTMTAPAISALAAVLAKVGKYLPAFKNPKSDPAYLEDWIRNRFADHPDFRVNFNKIDEYREHLLPKDKFPGEWIPVPPSMESGLIRKGRLIGGMPKSWLFTSLHFNPELLADAYEKTKRRALAASFIGCLLVAMPIYLLLGGYIDFDKAVFTSICATVACLLPFAFFKKLALAEHDVFAFNEAMVDIQKQVKLYGGDEASREEVSLYNTSLVELQNFSKVYADQLSNYWRLKAKGEPMVYFGQDDGTARARGSLHGYEAGTPIMVSVSDLNQNMLVTGKIGSGKTTGYGMPIFNRIVDAFMQAGYPIQGFGLDGKATIYIALMKVLQNRGIPTDKFVVLGVEDGQYGIPLTHGLSVEKCIEILSSTTKGESDPFFTPSALAQIARVLHIAKAYHQTPLGVEYEHKTGGCTADSFDFVKRLCNNPEILFQTIEDLCNCLEQDDDLRAALYTNSLRNAINGCLDDWKNMLKAEETASSVVATINVFLQDFTSNGKILERFGQGRVDGNQIDISLALQGYFMFSALADTEFGEAARKINIFARARLFNLITLREIEFKKAGKSPQDEPVLLFIDEHHLMASSGVTGLSDASIMNISRSMGLCFIALTQSQDAYIPVLGERQTENMVQQMLNRVYLPTKSEFDMKRLAETCGTRYEMLVTTAGIFATEGARELANGGVMIEPRTRISKLSAITPMGMPTTIVALNPKLVEAVDDKRVNTIRLPGYSKRFAFSHGMDYCDLVNSPARIQKHRDTYHRFGPMGVIGGLAKYNTGDETSADKSIFKNEGDMEARGRTDGINKAPLFTNDDLIDTGNFYAVMSVPQFGVEHWCRTKLEPLYV